MSGSERYYLDVLMGSTRKIASVSIPIGSDSEVSLNYASDWVKEGFAISPHLPLNGEFDHRAVRNFLQNLLPEGKGLEELTTNTTISKNNTFGLIKVIGEETSGALSFLNENVSSAKTHFREVTNNELITKLSRFKQYGESITYWDGRTRLSVAGVQDKLNLLELNGKLGFGEGQLCSNKIFKFETGTAPFIAVNELFTMLLAKYSGLEIPKVEVRSYGDVRAFVIERFDRKLQPEQNRVLRRHVIDGCQASNLPPSYKYERQHGDEGEGAFIRDGVSFPKLFKINTVNYEAYSAQLIRWMTFNLLVKNYDAHGKNISFFVGAQGLTLTPFYDLVNIEAIIKEIQKRQENAQQKVAPLIANSFAMSIGDYAAGSTGNFSHPFTAYMLADFANEFNISLSRFQLLMKQMVSSVLAAIELAKKDAIEQGLTGSEVEHINICIDIIQQAAEELLPEINQITDMSELF